MIKTYMPNGLMRAATDIVKAHPIDGGADRMSRAQLEQLMKRIEQCPEENIPVLAYELLRREIFAICRCISFDQYRSCISKAVQILSLRMSESLFSELFLQWQTYPGNRPLLRLLAEHDTDEYRGDFAVIPKGRFRAWIDSPDPFEEIVRYATQKYGDTFSDQYEAAGLSASFPLYDRCYGAYLTECGLPQMLREGQDRIVECVRRMDTTTAELILINLLISGSSDRKALCRFQKCFEEMLSMWHAPTANRFPKNQDLALKVYTWWYNYIEMSNSFLLDADPRRKNFWEKYLDRCEVMRFRQHRMVIFYFEHYCATEFEDVGRIYVYDREYFSSIVRSNMANQSRSQLKSWMYNSSQYLYEKSHQGRWEPEVASALRHYI